MKHRESSLTALGGAAAAARDATNIGPGVNNTAGLQKRAAPQRACAPSSELEMCGALLSNAEAVFTLVSTAGLI